MYLLSKNDVRYASPEQHILLQGGTLPKLVLQIYCSVSARWFSKKGKWCIRIYFPFCPLKALSTIIYYQYFMGEAGRLM